MYVMHWMRIFRFEFRVHILKLPGTHLTLSADSLQDIWTFCVCWWLRVARSAARTNEATPPFTPRLPADRSLLWSTCLACRWRSGHSEHGTFDSTPAFARQRQDHGDKLNTANFFWFRFVFSQPTDGRLQCLWKHGAPLGLFQRPGCHRQRADWPRRQCQPAKQQGLHAAALCRRLLSGGIMPGVTGQQWGRR